MSATGIIDREAKRLAGGDHPVWRGVRRPSRHQVPVQADISPRWSAPDHRENGRPSNQRRAGPCGAGRSTR